MSTLGPMPPPSPSGTGATGNTHTTQRNLAEAFVLSETAAGRNPLVPPPMTIPGVVAAMPAPVGQGGLFTAPQVPRCGGIATVNGVDFAWCGGGVNGTATERTTAASMLAYRPTEFKAKTNTEAT